MNPLPRLRPPLGFALALLCLAATAARGAAPPPLPEGLVWRELPGPGGGSAPASAAESTLPRLGVDDHFPFRLYTVHPRAGALRLPHDAAGEPDFPAWEPTGGGASGRLAPRPGEGEVVYGGSAAGALARFDHGNGETRAIDVWPDPGAPAEPGGDGQARYRFRPDFPLFTSPHDGEVLYAAGNQLFMTVDEGQSWQAISPDLTRGAPGAISEALESPYQADLFWAGSDDGLVHVSRDAGATWQVVTPAALPRRARVRSLEAAPGVPGGLYLTATAPSRDTGPQIFRATDFGRSWTAIHEGIDPAHPACAVRADPGRPGLIFAATRGGIYVSFDSGGLWRPLPGAPAQPVTDLAVVEDALFAVTRGGELWALDDLTPLRQLTAELAGAGFHLFPPRAVYRLPEKPGAAPGEPATDPPGGAAIYYLLPAEGTPEELGAELAVLDAEGGLVRELELASPRPVSEPAAPRLGRAVWDLRYPGVDSGDAAAPGPRAVPGHYLVRLTVGDTSVTEPLRVLDDPRRLIPVEALEEQFLLLSTLDQQRRALLQALDELEELEGKFGRLLVPPTGDSPVPAGDLSPEGASPGTPLQEELRALDHRFRTLARRVALGEDRPTEQAEAVHRELSELLDAHLVRLRELRQTLPRPAP